MKIFVTGADGFIGSHLTEALVGKGFDVLALSQYNSFNFHGWLDALPKHILQNAEIVSGDVRDRSQMMRLIKGQDAVVHLASLIAIPYSYIAPQSYVDTNITGTLNVLEGARNDGNVRVIHTSTSEVYGSAKFVPITEEHPLQGQSPYSASKIAADQLVHSFHASFDLPTVTIRPFNTFGPRQSQRAVIPSIITQILSGAKEIELGALTPTRDFSYVDDTVQGFVKALSADGIFGQTINLGSGFEVSIGQTVDLISKILGQTVRVNKSKERLRPETSEVDRLMSENARAKMALSWNPKYASLIGFEDGLKRTIEWFSDPGNLKLYNPSDYIV